MNFSLKFTIVCLTAMLAVNLAEAKAIADSDLDVPQPEEMSLIVVKDISDFAREYPELELVLMTKEPSLARDHSVRYTIGGRVSGDRLVEQGSGAYSYSPRRDVTVELSYPGFGSGSILTYVQLMCQQDNDDGNAYVVAGGIGQRYIVIVVEANQTETFTYIAQYYGKD